MAREPDAPLGDRPSGPTADPQAPPPPLAGEGREGAGLAPRPKWRVTPKTRERARALRRDLTNAERIIWYGLRAHRLDGAGFRRQVPVGPYIVDFLSHGAKLIIEIDGGQHFDDAYEARDRRRDAVLAGKGFRVLRFSNHEVLANRAGVLETIAAAVVAARAPSLPSPASGGGGARGTWRAQQNAAARDDASAGAVTEPQAPPPPLAGEGREGAPGNRPARVATPAPNTTPAPKSEEVS